MYLYLKRFLEQYLSFIRNHLPERPERSTVGLDIGTSCCKLVRLASSLEGLKVTHFSIEPVKNGNQAEAIKKLLEKIDIPSKEVCVSVSGQGTLIRFIKMPRMPISQLKQSLYIEADKYFPFSRDQVYMGCHVTEDGKGKDNKMLVLVAVAKRELVNQKLDLLKSLDLHTDFIGINSVAVSNAFAKLRGIIDRRQGKDVPRGESVAILDIGEIKSSLVIFTDKHLRFTRDISLGGKDLTQRISNVMGLSFADAESLKRKPEGKTEDLMTACNSSLVNLSSEIRLSFDYFTSEDNKEVKELYLLGSTAGLPGIVDFFSKELNIPVYLWDPTDALEFSVGVSKEEFQRNINQLVVALGLSLQDND